MKLNEVYAIYWLWVSQQLVLRPDLDRRYLIGVLVVVAEALRDLGVERVDEVFQRPAERLQKRVRVAAAGDVTAGGPEVVVVGRHVDEELGPLVAVERRQRRLVA